MRIAIVNDTAMAVEVIRRILMCAGRYEIAWVARNGTEAVQMCRKDPPDLILMDMIMPVMDGVEATRQIMQNTPRPILVVTASVDSNCARVFEAMGAGALDAVATPALGGDGRANGGDRLIQKIEMLRRLTGPIDNSRSNVGAALPLLAKTKRLVAIGASAGGPGALAQVLGGLPPGFPAAIVVVQHVDTQFALSLTNWLSEQTRLPTRLAESGDVPIAGQVLVANGGDHLALTPLGKLEYVMEPVEVAYRPSVDVFFESVTRYWQGELVGVLLTGMGRDGAVGLKALRERGHLTIAQDQATSAVYGMPKAAAALGAAMEILPLSRIGPRLRDVFVPNL